VGRGVAGPGLAVRELGQGEAGSPRLEPRLDGGEGDERFGQVRLGLRQGPASLGDPPEGPTRLAGPVAMAALPGGPAPPGGQPKPEKKTEEGREGGFCGVNGELVEPGKVYGGEVDTDKTDPQLTPPDFSEEETVPGFDPSEEPTRPGVDPSKKRTDPNIDPEVEFRSDLTTFLNGLAALLAGPGSWASFLIFTPGVAF
jgi:hypothetical protein